MSTNPVRGADAPDDADREARIEQLLLLGLDHYFAGHYEHAISVWTRVVFLERHHDRARAYIERARSALAERHRETDELVHTGVSAYQAGEIDKARELLTRAGDQGSDTAHIFLDRLNRVGTAAAGADLRIDPLPARPATRHPHVAMPQPRFGWTAVAAFAILVAVAMLLGGLPIGTWLSELQVAAPAPATQAAFDEPLPVVRASETLLVRARELYAGGRLRDALRLLDRVSMADPLRAEADRLRADVQRDLLAAAGIKSSAPGMPGVQP
jgi:tetratricopeptide (TPR) repeat protein